MSLQSPRSDVSLAGLCEQLGGELVGDGSVLIEGVAPLDSAGPKHLSFLSNQRYRPLLASTGAGAVLLSAADAAVASARAGCVFWIHANPYAQFARVAQLFATAEAPVMAGIHPSAVIEPGAKVSASASIGAHCVVGEGASIAEHVLLGAGCIVGRGVSIGASTRCYPRVTIYHDCVIGAGSILHSGVVIGADGFGFAPDGDAWIKIPQTGRVVIGDDVEIGANTTIDRGTMGDTRIGDGAKLDNQIQIGHNCDIGEGTVMAGCSAVAGSTKIGAHCMIGGAAMIIGHLTICEKVTISVGTVVSHSIHKPGFYTGFFPMQDNADWEKSAVLVRQLDKMRSRLKALEDQLKEQKGGA